MLNLGAHTLFDRTGYPRLLAKLASLSKPMLRRGEIRA
jgi:hypothetical protein